MIASPNRQEDMYARMFMLEAMEICLRTGHVDSAKSIGQASAIMKRRIDTHDYKLDDKWR